ncbi:hypothetical protein J6590_065956 [Homalodisca vitripennis]|nr:hypothetical protein J6590_065956 [Homalodisca vitripennis]
MDDVLLEEAESVKFLGMYLDRGLTWDFHIDSICSKAKHVRPRYTGRRSVLKTRSVRGMRTCLVCKYLSIDRELNVNCLLFIIQQDHT